ncbi:hypothetical protein DSO57_1015906 [Entomophthora muscae]|uniref:Uncharacterized protein n=1 Tax=Entomophthora muscae TaxID=34485 RepID=A0ACC2RWA0_9FUNG|nr:hypothetical protein DSO57_1015906 [Entomophthora muscae]
MVTVDIIGVDMGAVAVSTGGFATSNSLNNPLGPRFSVLKTHISSLQAEMKALNEPFTHPTAHLSLYEDFGFCPVLNSQLFIVYATDLSDLATVAKKIADCQESL